MRWVLHERTGLDVGNVPILEAFAAQRARFGRLVSTLDAQQWQAQSRCTNWSVHQVVRHVRDVAAVHVARLAGSAPPFNTAKPFSPATTPDEWLSYSDGESPGRTVEEFARLVVEEAQLLRTVAAQAPEGVHVGPLGRDLHWSVRSLHSFWDAWTHERDVSGVLGATPEYGPDEFRLATMYSLMAAAAPAANTGSHLRTVISLKGSPDGRYEISEEDGVVRVTSDADRPAELAGVVDSVLDSLSGRGPEPRDLLEGMAAPLEKLALLRMLAT